MDDSDDIDREADELIKTYIRMRHNGERPYMDSDDLALIMSASLDRGDTATAQDALSQMKSDFHDALLTHLSEAKWCHYNEQYDKALLLIRGINRRELEIDYPEEFCFAAHCALMCDDTQAVLGYYATYLRHVEKPDANFFTKITGLLVDVTAHYPKAGDVIDRIIEPTISRFPIQRLYMLACDTNGSIGRYDRCVSYLTSAADIDPFVSGVWKRFAFAYLKLGEDDKVRSSSEYYFALEPDSRDLGMLMILTEMQLADRAYDAALATATRAGHCAMMSATDHALVHMMTANAYKGLGDYRNQIESLKHALRYERNNVDAWADMARAIWTNENDPEKTLRFLKRAVRAAGDASPLLSMMTGVELELYDRTDDRRHLEHAIHTAKICAHRRPQTADYQLIAGRAMLVAGKYREAQTYFEKAYRMNPELEDALCYLVVTCVLNNHKIKFKRLYKLFVQKDSEAREKIVKIFPSIGPLLDKL